MHCAFPAPVDHVCLQLLF